MASASAASLSDQIEDLLECPICLERMTNPRLFPCYQHSFCETCVRRLVTESTTLATISCPLCRLNVPISLTGTVETTRDVTRSKLLELGSEKYCEGNIRYCEKHPAERVRRFCKKCCQNLCCDCLMAGDHLDHRHCVISISDAEKEIHQLLVEANDKNKLQLERLDKYKADYSNKADERRRELRAQVDKRVEELIELLHEEKRKLYDQIDEHISFDVYLPASASFQAVCTQAETLAGNITTSLVQWNSLEAQFRLYDAAVELWQTIDDITVPSAGLKHRLSFIANTDVPTVGTVELIEISLTSQQKVNDAAKADARIYRPPRPPLPSGRIRHKSTSSRWSLLEAITSPTVSIDNNHANIPATGTTESSIPATNSAATEATAASSAAAEMTISVSSRREMSPQGDISGSSLSCPQTSAALSERHRTSSPSISTYRVPLRRNINNKRNANRHSVIESYNHDSSLQNVNFKQRSSDVSSSQQFVRRRSSRPKSMIVPKNSSCLVM